MLKSTLIFLFICFACTAGFQYFLPIDTDDRKSMSHLELSEIGAFGLMRKARSTVPAHYHTGVDIKRPGSNYDDEPIYPIAQGVVISKRSDGPYAQLIIEHEGSQKFWTVYEHIAGIEVNLFDRVTPDKPIARFMNRAELNKHGWQFDHFHLEVLKVMPMKLKRIPTTPDRLFASYTLVCYTREDLEKYFYNPIEFLERHLK